MQKNKCQGHVNYFILRHLTESFTHYIKLLTKSNKYVFSFDAKETDHLKEYRSPAFDSSTTRDAS